MAWARRSGRYPSGFCWRRIVGAVARAVNPATSQEPASAASSRRTVFQTARHPATRPGSSPRGIMFGPSLSARSGSGMGLDEEPVGARRERRPRERRDEFPLAAALAARRARQLHAVRRVEDRRVAVPPHDRRRSACRRPGSGSRRSCPRSVCQISAAPPCCSLPVTCAISCGERNWPFFTLTARPVAAAARRRSVCRLEEGGDLQDVADLRDGGDLRASRGRRSGPGTRTRASPGRAARRPSSSPVPRAPASRRCGSPCRRSP